MNDKVTWFDFACPNESRTGATEGSGVGAVGTIGQAVTQAFLQESAQCLLDKDPLKSEDFPHAPERLHTIQGDVRRAEDMNQAVAMANITWVGWITPSIPSGQALQYVASGT